MITNIKEINNLDDPIKQFLLDFNISLPDGKSEDSDLGFKTKQLLLRAQSFTIPKITIDATEVWWSGHHRQFAGKQQRQGDWTVTFTEVWNGNYLDGFRKWMNWAHNYKNGTIALHNNYMGSATVNILNPDLYDPKPQTAVAKQMFLKMMYPTEVSVPEIKPSESAPVDITVTFHYNYFLMGDENE